MTEDVLRALGLPESECRCHRALRQHDETMLLSSYKFNKDEKKLAEMALRARQELEELFEKDERERRSAQKSQKDRLWVASSEMRPAFLAESAGPEYTCIPRAIAKVAPALGIQMSKIENRRARTAQASKPDKSPRPQTSTPSKTRNADAQKRTVVSDKVKAAKPKTKTKVTGEKGGERKKGNEAHGMLFMSPVSSIASSIGSVTGTGSVMGQSVDSLRNYFMDGGNAGATTQAESGDKNDETAKHISGSIDYPQTSILGLGDPPAHVTKKKMPQRISPNDTVLLDGYPLTVRSLAHKLNTRQISPFSVVELNGKKQFPSQVIAQQGPFFKVTSPSGETVNLEVDMNLAHLGEAKGWPQKYNVLDHKDAVVNKEISMAKLLKNYQFVAGDHVAQRNSDFNEYLPPNGVMLTAKPSKGSNILGTLKDPNIVLSDAGGASYVGKEAGRIGQKFLLLQNGDITKIISNRSEAEEFYATHEVKMDEGELSIKPVNERKLSNKPAKNRSQIDSDARHPLWGLPTLDFGASRLRRP